MRYLNQQDKKKQTNESPNKLAIDKAKGIICKPMPRTWFDRHAVNDIEDEEQKEFYKSIMADKKPYFMRYIYPSLKKEYNSYIKNTNKKSIRKFKMPMDKLLQIPVNELTDEQKVFIHYYDLMMPVGIHDCVMNKICKRFEEEFDGFVSKYATNGNFDYTILRSEVEYKDTQRRSIQKLYDEFNRRMRDNAILADCGRIDDIDNFEYKMNISTITQNFKNECYAICSNEKSLCNIILDMCYTKESTKKFAWTIMGRVIIENLLEKNDNIISFPKQASDGDLYFCGDTFATIQTVIGGME